MKYLTKSTDKQVGFIGTGAVSKSLARAVAETRPGFAASAYAFEYWYTPIKMMNFVSKLMNFAVKMMDFVPELMNFDCENDSAEFCEEMSAELGTSFDVCSTAQEVCERSDIIVTCTPGGATVLEKSWLKVKSDVELSTQFRFIFD